MLFISYSSFNCWILLSADNLCEQFWPRSGLTQCRSWSGSKLSDTLIVFLKDFFLKSQQTVKKLEELPNMQRVNHSCFFLLQQMTIFSISSWEFVTYHMCLNSHIENVHSYLVGTNGLNFGLSLHLCPVFQYASSEGSGETMHMCRLVWILPACLWDK